MAIDNEKEVKEFSIAKDDHILIYDEKAVHEDEGGKDKPPIFINGITQFSKGLELGGNASSHIAIFYDKTNGAIVFGSQEYVATVLLDKIVLPSNEIVSFTIEGGKSSGNK